MAEAALRPVVSFDDKNYRDRMALVMNQRLPARQQALRVLTERAVRYIIANAPRDTNRFVRAYQQAGNDLGVGPFVLVPIESGRYMANVRRLRRQVALYDFRVRAYVNADRMYYKGVKKSGLDKGYVKAKKQLDRAEAELAKLLEAGEDSGAIVIGGRRKAKSTSLSRLATVRTTVYGGEGRWLVGPDLTAARIVNREPHARLVNRNTRVVTDAVRAVRRYGGTLVTEKYLREASRGTPWLSRQLAS